MKKSIVYMIAVAVMAFSPLFGKGTSQDLKTLKIANDSAGSIYVSFGYNQGQLAAFLVAIPSKVTLEIKNWHVDRSTQIFVRDTQKPPAADGSTYEGDIYHVSPKKEISLQYSEKEGMRATGSSDILTLQRHRPLRMDSNVLIFRGFTAKKKGRDMTRFKLGDLLGRDLQQFVDDELGQY